MSGNKGEWSEVYVLLKLLADGRLYAADENLERIPNIFYPIIKILRDEDSTLREYCCGDEIVIIEAERQQELLRVPKAEFLEKSELLLNEISSATGRAFDIPCIQDFLGRIYVSSLKPTKLDKSDIKIKVHDLTTNMSPTLGFSIKSMLGQNSTLFNPGNTTNFIYQFLGSGIQDLDIDEINAINGSAKIKKRLAEMISRDYEIKFSAIQSRTFTRNLVLIDSRLPEILAYLLLYNYIENSDSKLRSLLQVLNDLNPLEFDYDDNHPYYEYKLKSFLTDAALGMTPAHIWTGEYDATGGIIIVKRGGEVLCYHIYNRNQFQDYLLNNTRLEQASTSRYNFGDLYRDGEHVMMKLNLQVRFN